MSRSSSTAFRPRRALAVAGLLSMGAGVLMLTAVARPDHAAASVADRSTAKPSPARERQFEAQARRLEAANRAQTASKSTTVTGPHMYDPATGQPFPNASTLTVTQTTSLVNQQVQVSWTNFTPSSALAYNPSNVAYPVMVTECKGTSPSSPADCYGAENGGVTSTSGQFGPMNDSYTTTATNGTGFTDLDILTSLENQFLGCTDTSPCSLAVVPAQGGNYSKSPPNCADHTADFSFGTGYAVGAQAFGSTNFSCSWAQRIVIPLTFARTAAFCPLKNAVFSAAGSPMAARAMESWVAALCVGSHGLTIAYDSTIAEPQALTDLGTGQTDIALTTRAASPQGISTGTKHYLYAPIAVSAVSIAYWFDNPVTGLPYTGINLNQRLVLKLLTQSYAFENDGCPSTIPGTPCDPGVDRNPLSMFADPEFQAVNPPFGGPTPQDSPPFDGYLTIPTVVSGNTDTSWTLTNWIIAYAQAKDFIAGNFDPWGMHINTYYKTLQWPNNSLVGQDPAAFISHLFNPVFPLSAVATDQVENWPPEFSDQKDQFGNFDRLTPELPGQRALVAIVGEGDSAAFLFPTAALPNPGCTIINPARMLTKCNFVQPTTASMTAALQGMTSAGQGTQQVNLAKFNKDAYPLTMVIYAVVPTSGTSRTKAAAIAKFLDFAAGAGQHPGVQPGQLPPGFAPLPASMQAQTRKDAQAVLHQTGATPPPKTTNPSTPPGGSSPGSSTTPTSGSSPGSVALPTVAPSPGAPGSGISLVNTADVHPASVTRYILPALLILGGLAALAGSSSLIGSSSTPISARLRRISEGGKALGRTARGRLGLKNPGPKRSK
jgi:hypothetical protein